MEERKPVILLVEDDDELAQVYKARFEAEGLNTVWAATKGFSAVALSRITHREGSAWRAAFEAGQRVIDDDALRDDRTYLEPLGIAG